MIAEIELTSHCQLACPFCRTGKALRDKYPAVPRGFMSKETLLRILDQTPSLQHVLLYNWGEPFLHPDLVWCIEQTKRKVSRCDLSSNMQLFSKELAEGIINAGLDLIRVSCDGASQETYGQYRKGGSLEKVLTHARMLAEAKQQMKSQRPIIMFQMVVTKFNEHEAGSFYNFARSHGADDVSQINICGMTPEGFFMLPEYEPVSPQWKRYWAIGLLNSCNQPWEHITYDWNGDVYTCCNPSGITSYKMGNIHESTFTDIWNGPKYQYVRRFCKTKEAETNGYEIMCHACFNKFPSEEARSADMYYPCLKHLHGK